MHSFAVAPAPLVEPALLQLVSPWRATCHAGRFSGFLLLWPNMCFTQLCGGTTAAEGGFRDAPAAVVAAAVAAQLGRVAGRHGHASSSSLVRWSGPAAWR